DGDDRIAEAREMRREAQRAVAAKRDHGIDAKRLEDGEDMVGAVAFLHRAGINARGVQHRAAQPVDATYRLTVERTRVERDAGRVGEVDAEQALPTAPEAEHLPA